MELLRSITLYSEARGMPFVVAGGIAVNVHGYSRVPLNLDLIVEDSQRAKWDGLMARIDYRQDQHGATFARFTGPDPGSWPVDFTYVDEHTFKGLYEKSEVVAIGAATVRVVTGIHLIALKIHAMSARQSHRFSKDLCDVMELLRLGVAGVDEQELSRLCEQYADRTLYDTLKTALAGVPGD